LLHKKTTNFASQRGGAAGDGATKFVVSMRYLLNQSPITTNWSPDNNEFRTALREWKQQIQAVEVNGELALP